MQHRVVITGVGAVTPLGLNASTSLESVRAGQSGIGTITSFDASDLAVQIGGEVRGFEPSSVVSRSDQRRLDPHALYAVNAGLEAMRDAIENYEPGAALPFTPERFAVTIGTSAGPVTLVQEATRALDAQGPKRVLPGVVIYGGSDSGAAYLSTLLGARGATAGIGATCASGAVGLGEALRTIRHGYADAVLVVGAEHCLNRVNVAANVNIRALTPQHSDEPKRASRPFDRGRSGFVMSSGAAAMLLESEHSARSRGAHILGVLEGYGASSDAHHATAPHAEGIGAAQAMRQAIADAGLTPAVIDHVNAHATATVLGDPSEVAALRLVFDGAVPPITATKSVSGHLLGAAGVFEAIVSLDAIRQGMIPPTINLDDPEFDLDIVVGEGRIAPLEKVLTNSFGFGGHNASLVIGKYQVGHDRHV